MHDVHVWGDSHWRVFFPFVNHEAPGVYHEQDKIRMIDMVANELSGATMYGLLNDNSKNGARRRILNTLDDMGGVRNVALVFGEVDARYHHKRYYVDDMLSRGRVMELLGRYRRFIEEDLLWTERVRGQVFVYHSFEYPQLNRTLLHPSIEIGKEGYLDATHLNRFISRALPMALDGAANVITLDIHGSDVSVDGVHLVPERVFPRVFEQIRDMLRPELREIPF